MAPKDETPHGAAQQAVNQTENVLDTGGGGGGGGGGGSSNATDRQRPYRSMLIRLGIPLGPYGRLIAQAAADGWTADEFMYELSLTTSFNQMFPGIQSLLERGMSISSAVQTWKNQSVEYEQRAKDMGLAHLARLTPRRIGILIANNVSVDEFQMRLGMLDTVKNSDTYRAAFNRILTNNGQRALDRKGWYQFLMGKGDQRLYDLYEGTILLEQLGPEGLATKEARMLARALAPGKLADLSAYQETISGIRSTVGSQALRDAGIETKDLALVALKDQLASGDIRQRASQIEGMLNQMLTNAAARAKSTEPGAVYVSGGRPVSATAPQGDLAG